ncbi:hypothetical protein BFW91_02030 [Pseudomonas fluorescens]|jgi:hypothetical protein|uniref:hypothetical protein n=1 Tax=Pseudomonas fluorescens TaxID=294 RepID=UPI00099C584A|nr:hypothetical protein [Pseudomonas fluorescens]OPB16887.1 hypothetical protein BFW91_02030 [Pseudomonas fluorescens]
MAIQNEHRLALYSAGFTLFGVIITSVTGWVTTAQTSSISARQSCLTRVDERESKIRSKAEDFLAAQGGIASFAAKKTYDQLELEKRIDEVTRTGFALSSYLDEEDAATTQLLVLGIGTRLDTRHVDSTEKDSTEYKQHLAKWHSNYRKLLSSLEQKRKDC